MAGIVFDAPVEPDDMTIFIRDTPIPSDLTLLNEFPTQEVDDNTIDWGEITRTNRTARYRPFDGRIHVSQRDGATDKRVNLLPLSTSLNMGEYERLQVQFARTGGTRQESLVNAIYNDAERLTREVWARLEQAWGDVLTDGKLTITEGGLQAAEADFGVPGSQIVAPAILWSNLATAVPLTNMRAWQDTRIANGNGPATRAKTSLAILRMLQRNTEVINAVYGSTAGRTQVSVTELNDLLRDEMLPVIDMPYDTQVDVDGTPTRVIAADKFVMMPENLSDLGYTAVGVSATALELVDSNLSDFSFSDAPGIVGVVIKQGPPFRQYTFVDAVAMPVLTGANRLSVADVVA